MTMKLALQQDVSSQIKRNVKAGLLIGFVLAGWKFKGLYQDIIESAYSDYKKILKQSPPEITITITSSTHSTYRFKNSKTRSIFAFLRYFKNFPLFLTSFTIIFKYIIHSKIFAANNLSANRYQISFLTFIISYICQYTFNCFTWNWALFLLIRSLFSFSKLIIPTNLQPNVLDIYPIIHGMLGLCLAFKCKYVPSKWWNLVEKCVNEKKDRWYYMLGNHHHNILPPCCSVVHEKKLNGDLQLSCLKSFILDNIKRSAPIFLFFAKFYALTSMFGVMGLVKALKKESISSVLLSKLRSVFGSFGFFMIGVAIAGRVPCFYKWFLWKLSGKPLSDYNCIGSNNRAALLLSCVILGKLSILCEIKPRRVDVALSCIWNISQQIIRMCCNLESEDDAKYHVVLGSNKFTSILFAVNMGIVMFVYCSNPQCLKSMERNIITNYLMK